MEEDIKILKDLKDKWKLTVFGDIVSVFSVNEIQAVEHLLNRLEQDERVIEEMAEYIHIQQHCKALFGGKTPVPYLKEEIIDYFRKKCE